MSATCKRTRSKAQFPVRFHEMITYCEKHGLQSVIEWVLGGRGFFIHDPEKLVDVIAIFFGKMKYKSFIRQLNMWDFDRVPNGPNKGMYMHPYFVKGNPELCGQMNRQIKKKAPRARPSSRSIRQQQKEKHQQKQKIQSSDNMLGSVVLEATECSRRLSNNILNIPTNLQTKHMEQDDIMSDENPFSCSSSCSSTDNVITRTNLHQDTCAADDIPTYREQIVCEVDMRVPQPSYSSFPSWLLPTPLPEEVDRNLPKWCPSRRGSGIIEDIIKDYGHLFELDAGKEENFEESALMSTNEEFALSSSLLPCAIEVDTSQVRDKSCFAGRDFFLVKNDDIQIIL